MDVEKHKPLIGYREPGPTSTFPVRIVFGAVYAIMIVFPASAYWLIRTPDLSGRVIGIIAGFIGFTILATQSLLSGRLKFVDNAFGVDSLMRLHRYMAVVAGVMILAHPILRATIFAWSPRWNTNVGRIALALLVFMIVFSFAFKLFRVDYQVWRALHKLVVPFVILAFLHTLPTFNLQPVVLRAYFILLIIMVVGIFLHQNIIVPLWLRRRFRVVSVDEETHDTWTLTMVPEDGRRFDYRPGQFTFLKLRRDDARAEQHTFTISSSPTRRDAITVTIKDCGDYTSTIGKTKPGIPALIEGPFGRFSFIHNDVKKFIFIAGGVGITPIMSMLRYLRDTGDKRPAILLYGNRTERDVIFRQELENLPSHVKVVHVLERPPEGWKVPAGYITPEVIRQYAGDFLKDADVYLCGPPIMMDSVQAHLKSLDVPRRKVHLERFVL